MIMRSILFLFAIIASGSAASTIITFTFHDTFGDGAVMARYLEECGYRGTFYVSALRLCLHPDYLDRDDVNKLFLKGHQIGGHGLSHAKSFDLSPEQLELQFCCNRELLKQYRWRPTTMAYPHGQYNHTIRKMAQHCGNCNALHVGGLRAPETCLDCPTAESIPPVDKWQMKSYSVLGTDTLQNLIDRVEMAINDDTMPSKWVILNFHKLCNEGDDKCTQYTHFTMVNVFARFVQYVQNL